MTDSTRPQQIALLAIAGGSVAAMTAIALVALKIGNVDANGATLVGVIVGGLAASVKDIISAVRGYSMSAQLGKVTDQLAASGPAITDTPQPVTVENAPDKPVPVEPQS